MTPRKSDETPNVSDVYLSTSNISSRASKSPSTFQDLVRRWRTVVHRVLTAGPYVNERFSTFALSLVAVAGILVVAFSDRAVGPAVSLASLYFLPLALSALVHPLRVSIGLAVVCVLMHHLIESWWNFGTAHLGRDLVSLGGYLFMVLVVNQLGRQRRRLAEIAQQQRDELASEIHLAAEVQQNILPRTVPSLHGFEIAARMTPAKEVAGDYYGFIEQADGSVSLVIADVSGKGVAAGLLMPSIEIALRLDSPRHSRAHELIENFNGVVCQLTAGSRFISMFYARMWPATRRIEYTNAGHNPPLLLREGSAQQLSCGGPVLGILPEAKYESEFIELRKDDVLLLYTDGLVEAENPAGVFYSTHRLISIALANTNSPADKIVEAIYASVTEFRGKPIMEDDATLVVVKVL